MINGVVEVGSERVSRFDGFIYWISEEEKMELV